MHSTKCLDRFQLHQNKIRHEEVGPESLLKSFPAEGNRNGLLPLHAEPLLLQHVGKQHLIDRLQQARSQISVKIKSGLHDDRSDFVLLHSRIMACLALLARARLRQTEGISRKERKERQGVTYLGKIGMLVDLSELAVRDFVSVSSKDRC